MADENKTTKPIVDETPISPSKPNPKRKNSLERHLAQRPEKAELVQKNILPDSSAAPGLQAHQKEVHKHPEALCLPMQHA